MPNYSLAFLRNWTNLKIEIVPIGTVKLFRVNVNVIFLENYFLMWRKSYGKSSYAWS